MSSYLGAIWRCRYFWMSLVKNDLRTRYRRSILGMGWSLLNPIAMTIILTVVFTKILGAADPNTYALSVLAGLAGWNYVRNVTILGCLCLFQGESYIRQYPAPMAIYPLRTALGESVHFLIQLTVVLALSWYLNGFANLHTLPLLLPTVVLLFLLGWALAVLAGFATVHFHDTQHLCEIGFQIVFYATPIMYADEMLKKIGLGWMLYCNPVPTLLRLVRDPILGGGKVPDAVDYLFAVFVVGLAIAGASLVLVRLQRRLIFHL